MDSALVLAEMVQRVICSIERQMKRANRVLFKLVTWEQYAALVNAWTAHLRWMRLHIAYFKPLPKTIRGCKIGRQAILDELVLIAARGIRYQAYQPPELEELRRIMRL